MEGEQKISFISYIYTKNSSTNTAVINKDQSYATTTSNNQNTKSPANNSYQISDEDIITNAIQATGASSLIDIVKIINYIKENNGKEIDENLAISLLQKRLNNL